MHSVAAAVEQTAAHAAAGRTRVADAADRSSRELEETARQVTAAVEGEITSIHSGAVEVGEAVVHAAETLASFGQAQEGETTKLGEMVGGHVMAARDALTGIQDQVARTVTQEIRKDMPTGKTPAKQVR